MREQCSANFVAMDSMNLWIDIARDSLVQTISGVDCVILNDAVLGPAVVAAFELRGADADALLQLTAVERVIAADLVRGLSNREIAARRNRSERTVANQVASILAKLRASSRRALAVRLARPTLASPKNF